MPGRLRTHVRGSEGQMRTTKKTIDKKKAVVCNKRPLLINGGNSKMTDKNNAAFYYSVNMLRTLLALRLITEEEYKRILKISVDYYGVENIRFCL